MFALVELIRGELAIALAGVAAAAVTGAVTRYWSVTHPGPMPHLLRWSLLVPRGNGDTPATRVVFRIPMRPSMRRTSSGCSARSLIPTLRWSSSAAFSSRRDAS